MLRDAIRHYHDLLESDLARAREAWEGLTERMQANRLSFGGRPLCTVLRPHFITIEQYRLIERVCGVLVGAIYRLQRELPKQPAWLEMLDLSPGEMELAAIEPGYDWISRTCRLDSFLDEQNLQFVEFNAEAPAGISYADGLAEIFASSPIMKTFQESYSFHGFSIKPRVEEVLLKAWQEFGGKNRPTLAIVDYRGLPTATEFEMFREYFERRGLKAVVCDPRELDYSGGRLRWQDVEIDLVYRRVLVNEFLDKLPEVQPLLNAYRDHAVCMINSFRVKLVHKKMLFGLLTDDALGRFFTEEERETISRHIPWTRRMAESSTTRHGQRIDLGTYVRDHKDQLVLKPNDEYGGKGVYVGWELSGEQWESAMKTAFNASYVVQEKVHVAKALFPRFNPGFEYATMLVDLDPYIFDGSAYGCLTRLSETALCNVTSGGGQAATFVVSRR